MGWFGEKHKDKDVQQMRQFISGNGIPLIEIVGKGKKDFPKGTTEAEKRELFSLDLIQREEEPEKVSSEAETDEKAQEAIEEKNETEDIDIEELSTEEESAEEKVTAPEKETSNHQRELAKAIKSKIEYTYLIEVIHKIANDLLEMPSKPLENTAISGLSKGSSTQTVSLLGDLKLKGAIAEARNAWNRKEGKVFTALKPVFFNFVALASLVPLTEPIDPLKLEKIKELQNCYRILLIKFKVPSVLKPVKRVYGLLNTILKAGTTPIALADTLIDSNLEIASINILPGGGISDDDAHRLNGLIKKYKISAEKNLQLIANGDNDFETCLQFVSSFIDTIERYDELRRDPKIDRESSAKFLKHITNVVALTREIKNTRVQALSEKIKLFIPTTSNWGRLTQNSAMKRLDKEIKEYEAAGKKLIGEMFEFHYGLKEIRQLDEQMSEFTKKYQALLKGDLFSNEEVIKKMGEKYKQKLDEHFNEVMRYAEKAKAAKIDEFPRQMEVKTKELFEYIDRVAADEMEKIKKIYLRRYPNDPAEQAKKIEKFREEETAAIKRLKASIEDLVRQAVECNEKVKNNTLREEDVRALNAKLAAFNEQVEDKLPSYLASEINFNVNVAIVYNFKVDIVNFLFNHPLLPKVDAPLPAHVEERAVLTQTESVAVPHHTLPKDHVPAVEPNVASKPTVVTVESSTNPPKEPEPATVSSTLSTTTRDEPSSTRGRSVAVTDEHIPPIVPPHFPTMTIVDPLQKLRDKKAEVEKQSSAMGEQIHAIEQTLEKDRHDVSEKRKADSVIIASVENSLSKIERSTKVAPHVARKEAFDKALVLVPEQEREAHRKVFEEHGLNDPNHKKQENYIRELMKPSLDVKKLESAIKENKNKLNTLKENQNALVLDGKTLTDKIKNEEQIALKREIAELDGKLNGAYAGKEKSELLELDALYRDVLTKAKTPLARIKTSAEFLDKALANKTFVSNMKQLREIFDLFMIFSSDKERGGERERFLKKDLVGQIDHVKDLYQKVQTDHAALKSHIALLDRKETLEKKLATLKESSDAGETPQSSHPAM